MEKERIKNTPEREGGRVNITMTISLGIKIVGKLVAGLIHRRENMSRLVIHEGYNFLHD